MALRLLRSATVYGSDYPRSLFSGSFRCWRLAHPVKSPVLPDVDAAGIRLVAEGLGRVFGPRRVLRDVSFDAGFGEVVAICGANGSGKSTLIRMLAGLLAPSSGQTWIELSGRRLLAQERRAVSTLASPAMQPYLHLSFAENLAFFTQGRALKCDCTELAELVGLSGRMDDLVGSYSSGMIQRTRLALALSARPRALFLDEPTQFLDQSGRALVEQLVAAQRKRGLTVIATNDEFDASLADRSFVLTSGGVDG